MKRIPLTLTSRPEVYYGDPTGLTQFRAEATNPHLLPDIEDYTHEDWCRFGSILGRDTHGPDAALGDWSRRAKADGHFVIGYLHTNNA
jgi:hypothetical protein